MLEIGSGETFAINRVPALAACAVSAAPPARRARNHFDSRIGFPESKDGEQCATQRPNKRVERIIGRIDPRDFVREEFQEIKRPGDRNHPRIAEHEKIVEVGRQDNPSKVNGHSRDEDG